MLAYNKDGNLLHEDELKILARIVLNCDETIEPHKTRVTPYRLDSSVLSGSIQEILIPQIIDYMDSDSPLTSEFIKTSVDNLVENSMVADVVVDEFVLKGVHTVDEMTCDDYEPCESCSQKACDTFPRGSLANSRSCYVCDMPISMSGLPVSYEGQARRAIENDRANRKERDKEWDKKLRNIDEYPCTEELTGGDISKTDEAISNSYTQRFLCNIGFHKWGLWMQTPDKPRYQEKICNLCGYTKERHK